MYPIPGFNFSLDTDKSNTNNIDAKIQQLKDESAIYIVHGCFYYETMGKQRFTAFCAYPSPYEDSRINMANAVSSLAQSAMRITKSINRARSARRAAVRTHFSLRPSSGEVVSQFEK
jgi:hypothetical protein